MKKLLVDVSKFTAAHREAIAQSAGARGYEAVFARDGAHALAEAVDAEIIFSGNLALPRVAGALKWLCVPSAGAEAYLSPDIYASPEAILTNSSGAYGVTISEHIVMVALTLMRRQLEYAEVVRNRDWLRELPMRSIRGSRVAVLGTGDIGRETAKRLRAFSPKSITGVNRSGRNPEGLFDRAVPASGLDALLPETDLLVMALPGTPETAGLMDGRRLALLPKDAFLINVGRGSAVDQRALQRLMEGGHLAGAALDVFEREPLAPEDALWRCPRLLITPHIAGDMSLPYTADRIVQMFLEDFENYCAGKPLLHQVDRTLGY